METSALRADAAAFVSPAQREQEAGSRMPSMLIADDDPSIVRVLADRCARMGFAVDTASNGRQVLAKATRSKPDILVIDINMPEVDGLSVCEQLQDLDQRALNVVVITGSRDLETIQRCHQFGALFARKGVNFWADLETALIEIYPARAGRIDRSGLRSVGVAVKRQPRILVVDDDICIKQFLADRLAKCGVGLLYASDAQQACRISYREEPTVIVADYFMPHGDAQYLLAKLRSLPATQDIPVIVLSGRDLDDLTIQSLTSKIAGHPGASHILRKSMDTSELFAALQEFCGFAS